MSALPPKADIAKRDRHVRFVPKADIHSFWRDFGPVGLHLLQSCCEAMDLADQAGQVLREQGLTYTGRRGGALRPEFRIERSAQAFVLKALHELTRPNKQRPAP